MLSSATLYGRVPSFTWAITCGQLTCGGPSTTPRRSWCQASASTPPANTPQGAAPRTEWRPFMYVSKKMPRPWKSALLPNAGPGAVSGSQRSPCDVGWRNRTGHERAPSRGGRLTGLGALLGHPKGEAIAKDARALAVDAELKLHGPVLGLDGLGGGAASGMARRTTHETRDQRACQTATPMLFRDARPARTVLLQSQPVLLWRSGVRRMYLLVLTTVEPPKSQ